jgi:uncharacterized protein YndB with AHSA1/START domain
MELHLERNVQVPIEEIFNDFRDKEKMKMWFRNRDYCSAEVQSDFSKGGKYHFEILNELGNSFHYFGEYTDIKENSHIDMVWNDSEVENTLVTFDFTRNPDNSTKIHLTHANIPNKKFYDDHEDFWEGCLSHLIEYAYNMDPYSVYKE